MTQGNVVLARVLTLANSRHVHHNQLVQLFWQARRSAVTHLFKIGDEKVRGVLELNLTLEYRFAQR